MTIERTFDARPSLDPRNADYPLRPLLAGVTEPRSYTWTCSTRLDQGAQGSCVGHGWGHELTARPAVVAGIDHAAAVRIYDAAQQVDEWPGAEPEYSGTSVNAGAKVLRDHGYLTGWRWAVTAFEVALAVGFKGPVVLGVPWYEAMAETSSTGFITPAGGLLGGHCVTLIGVRVNRAEPDATVFTGVNSWGPGWGDGGLFRITARDLDRLLNLQGEACVPFGRRARGLQL